MSTHFVFLSLLSFLLSTGEFLTSIWVGGSYWYWPEMPFSHILLKSSIMVHLGT